MVAPPFLPVPPPRFGGTVRIVAALADCLYRRGHDVTLFASGDSTVSARVVPIVPRALWSEAVQPSQEEAMASVVDFVENYGEDFDIFHSHLEWHGFAWARRSAVPVVSTLHGRIDIGRTADVIAEYRDIPLIAISGRQRSFAPDQNWVATIHHGLPLESVPAGGGSGGYLLFVGRLTPEKGIDAAIELARRANLPLIVAAKALEPHEVETYERLVRPAEEDGALRFLGEVGQPARDKLLGDALATVMLGDWPEPFGLVAVESMATGTPVLARRAGALPEIVRDGVDGFVVDSVEDAERAVAEITALDRAVIRADALRRF
ncbi:MAG TPA: glycosyltransferase family 4 protein, partial [Vicinamibacterales bacterium]|nr:glycosyltransferase family 4 protein [Vicinamibacterales bacterium]